MTALRGAELVEKGVADLGRGEQSVEALLVSMSASGLERLGYRIPSPIESAEEKLYELLAQEDSDSAPGRYNELARRLVTLERAENPREVDQAASHLCDIAERLLNQVRQPVWDVEWDFVEENSLRDAARAVERYRLWAATGEDDFINLRPGLEPQIALGDDMLQGVSYLVRTWKEHGDPLDPGFYEEIVKATERYWQIRQEEGGPGFVNMSTWFHPSRRLPGLGRRASQP